MNELSIVSILIGFVFLVFILGPFFWGEGGFLQDAARNDSPENLKTKQSAILDRWIQDEEAANSGLITAREWKMRKIYLTNRYVDTTRRLEWLESRSSQ